MECKLKLRPIATANACTFYINNVECKFECRQKVSIKLMSFIVTVQPQIGSDIEKKNKKAVFGAAICLKK